MKEEPWSIRKMRELQKRSTSKNTYKRVDEGPLGAGSDLNDEENEGILVKFYQRLSMFLEE